MAIEACADVPEMLWLVEEALDQIGVFIEAL
jgi:hypothetical protein